MELAKLISQYDQNNMLKLLLSFPDQFADAYEIGTSFEFAASPEKIRNIIFSGMGGSAIGGDIIISYLNDELKIPTFVNRGYSLPKFIDRSSLVIVSSFSGNTEESLNCYEQAKDKRAQIVCVTSGGKLKKEATSQEIPLISIPGGMPPRCALGYLTIPVLVFLMKSGFAKFSTDDFEEAKNLLKQKAADYASPSLENNAYQLAQKLYHKIPIIYSTNDMLFAVAMRWKGQFSENAKVLAFANFFPELNHNEIVGWEKLPDILTKLQIIYLHDKDDFSRNQARMDITKSILEKVTNSIIELSTEGVSRLARIFSLIYLGDMSSFYLAMLNQVDPTPIEKIQLLKDQLQKLN